MPGDQRGEGRLVAALDEPLEELDFAQSRDRLPLEQLPEVSLDRHPSPDLHGQEPRPLRCPFTIYTAEWAGIVARIFPKGSMG